MKRHFTREMPLFWLNLDRVAIASPDGESECSGHPDMIRGVGLRLLDRRELRRGDGLAFAYFVDEDRHTVYAATPQAAYIAALYLEQGATASREAWLKWEEDRRR